jgi:hypothetical protein
MLSESKTLGATLVFSCLGGDYFNPKPKNPKLNKECNDGTANHIMCGPVGGSASGGFSGKGKGMGL